MILTAIPSNVALRRRYRIDRYGLEQVVCFLMPTGGADVIAFGVIVQTDSDDGCLILEVLRIACNGDGVHASLIKRSRASRSMVKAYNVLLCVRPCTNCEMGHRFVARLGMF